MAKYIIKYKKFSGSTASDEVKYIQFDSSLGDVKTQIFEYELFGSQYDNDATTGKDYYLAGWSTLANQHLVGDALNVTDDGASFFTGLNTFGSSLELAGTVSSIDELPISEDNTVSHVYYVSEQNNFYKWDGTEWGVVLTVYTSKATVAALPSSGNEEGDRYVVEEDEKLYEWDGDSWEEATRTTNDSYIPVLTTYTSRETVAKLPGGTITGAAESTPSSGSVTYTNSAAHNFAVGDSVVVTGSSISGYNGTFTITAVPTTTTFAVENSTTGTETWSSGAAKAKLNARYLVEENDNLYNWDGASWKPITPGDFKYWDGDSWEALGARLYAVWVEKAASVPVEDQTQIVAKDQAEENKLVNKALTKLPAPVIGGMTLGADIKIGNLTLNTIDSNGVVWVCTDIDGWWTTPDPELPDLPRGWGDGSYDARGRYAARQINLTGAFLTQDPSQVAAARKALIEAIDLVYDGGDLIVNETPAKLSFVRLNGRPQIATVNARGRTEFSVGLKASDPIKYEYLPEDDDDSTTEEGYRVKTIATTVSTPFPNAGNTRTPVIIELTGPIPVGATIANAIDYIDANKDDVTETITIVKAVPSGSTLEIDTLNREALLVTSGVTENGRSYISTLSSWFYIQPDAKAENELTFTSSTGSCKVFYRSGWIG